MIRRIRKYRVRCSGCDKEKVIETCSRLEGQMFRVKGWTLKAEHTRGGPNYYHYCPKCSKHR